MVCGRYVEGVYRRGILLSACLCAALACVPGSVRAEAIKVYVAKERGSDEAEKKRRKEFFLDKCLSEDYNAQCVKFFETEFNPRRSKEYCLKHPDDGACIERLRALEHKKTIHNAITRHRELLTYCKENPKTKRCSTLRKRKNKPPRSPLPD